MDSRAGTGSSVGRGFALTVPFLLFFAGVFFLGMYLLHSVVEETAYFGMIVGESASESILYAGEEEADEPEEEFIPTAKQTVLSKTPSIAYGKKFARLNVTWDGGGWDIKNIPVYVGADKKLLKKGAGMSFSSSFPGEGGCTIISAHVTRHFAQLEDTPNGAIVTIETSYGTYTYRVVGREVVKGTDASYKDAGRDTDLMLYTCYPRDNGGKRRTQRCVLICELIPESEVQR